MAARGRTPTSFSVGSPPPTVTWTVVKGDTASFRVYVTDENKVPLVIPDWEVEMDIVRPSTGDVVVALEIEPTLEDGDGEFTVAITSEQSDTLLTGDIFDIQLSDATRVWTIARGSMIMIDDVTD